MAKFPLLESFIEIVRGWLKGHRTEKEVRSAAKDATFEHLAIGIDMVKKADGERGDQEREDLLWHLGKEGVIDKLRYWMSNGATIDDVSRVSDAIKHLVYAIGRGQVAWLKVFVDEQKRFGSTPATRFLDETIMEYYLWSEFEDE
jgi:hypothetical protein